MSANPFEELNIDLADFGFIERLLVKEALLIAERREVWAMNKAVLAPVVNALRQIGAEVSLSGSLDVRLIGDKHVLANAVRILRTAGYGFTTTRPEKGDTQWSAFFYRQGGMEIWFQFSSSVCRRVQTGTKMVEQPIFETVCDSIELPALPEDEAKPKLQLVDQVPF